jgi:hypothetical protein
MPVYRMELPDDAHWAPLEKVAELVATTNWPTLDPDDFMYMGREVGEEEGVADVHLYKAIDTRRYLNLDDQGHAYWYCGPVADDGSFEIDTPCVYELAPTLEAAIRHVRS